MHSLYPAHPIGLTFYKHIDKHKNPDKFLLRVSECSEKCNKVEMKVPQTRCKVSQSINNSWVTIQKRSIANKLLYEPTGPKWMLFKKKKRLKTTVYFRIFFPLLSCSSIGSIPPPPSPIGTFCCPIQKSRSFAPRFLLLPVRRIIVHLGNLIYFDRNKKLSSAVCC